MSPIFLAWERNDNSHYSLYWAWVEAAACHFSLLKPFYTLCLLISSSSTKKEAGTVTGAGRRRPRNAPVSPKQVLPCLSWYRGTMKRGRVITAAFFARSRPFSTHGSRFFRPQGSMGKGETAALLVTLHALGYDQRSWQGGEIDRKRKRVGMAFPPNRLFSHAAVVCFVRDGGSGTVPLSLTREEPLLVRAIIENWEMMRNEEDCVNCSLPTLPIEKQWGLERGQAVRAWVL